MHRFNVLATSSFVVACLLATTGLSFAGPRQGHPNQGPHPYVSYDKMAKKYQLSEEQTEQLKAFHEKSREEVVGGRGIVR